MLLLECTLLVCRMMGFFSGRYCTSNSFKMKNEYKFKPSFLDTGLQRRRKLSKYLKHVCDYILYSSLFFPFLAKNLVF